MVSKNFKNLWGQSHGMLTVIDLECDPRLQKGKGKYATWYCLCECGETTHVSSRYLTMGKTRSCGCTTKRGKASKYDMVGQRFGKLVVREPGPKIMGNKKGWSCECDCGKWRVVTRDQLLKGSTTCCGCSSGSRYKRPKYTYDRRPQ